MLKVKTPEDYREEFCALLLSGKYKQVRFTWYVHPLGDDTYEACAVSAWYHYNHPEKHAMMNRVYNVQGQLAYFSRTIGLSPESIMAMNDRGRSFEKIADYIQRHSHNAGALHAQH
jgi:hypothetical protein